jgi:hypothetical protein
MRTVGREKWTLVHIQVEIETHLEKEPALNDTGRNIGRSHRSEKQRIKPAPLFNRCIIKHNAVTQVTGSAEVVIDTIELDARGADDIESHGDDLMTDSVSGDDSDSVTHDDSDWLLCR